MSENPVVLLETSSGDILVELFPDKAPKQWKIFYSMLTAVFTAILFFTASFQAL